MAYEEGGKWIEQGGNLLSDNEQCFLIEIPELSSRIYDRREEKDGPKIDKSEKLDELVDELEDKKEEQISPQTRTQGTINITAKRFQNQDGDTEIIVTPTLIFIMVSKAKLSNEQITDENRRWEQWSLSSKISKSSAANVKTGGSPVFFPVCLTDRTCWLQRDGHHSNTTQRRGNIPPGSDGTGGAGQVDQAHPGQQ